MLRRDCAAVADYLIRHRLGFGSDPAGLQARLEGLLAARRLRGGLVEVDGGRGGWRLAALGLSSFIEDTTLDAVLQSQDAAFGADLLRGPETRLLDDRAQARLGATGLNLAILTFHFDGEGLAPNLVDLVLARALDHFVAAHRGYAIKSMLRADPEEFLPLILQTGLRVLGPCRPVAGLPAMHFVGFQPEDRAKARPGGVAQMFLHFGPPVMQCTVAECRVLDLATAGLSDPEIAAELGISANTVKALWRSVLARGSRALDLTGGRPEPDPVRPVRGAELRSHILLHLRDNPQDMRPFRLR